MDLSSRHHWNVASDNDQPALRGLLSSIPPAVRVSVIVAWFTVAVFAKWEAVNDHDLSPAVWAVLVPGLVIIVASGLRHLRRTFAAPDRAPFDFLSVGSHVFFVTTGTLIVLGAMTIVDDDPATEPSIGGPMLLVGLLLVALFVRHIVKPVRGAPERLVKPEPRESGETAAGGSPWYASDRDHPAT